MNGDVSDPKKFVEAISAVEITSPRGPIKSDKETHNIIQNMYIMETDVENGATENKVIDTIGGCGPVNKEHCISKGELSRKRQVILSLSINKEK